jgi:hypothetical protein
MILFIVGVGIAVIGGVSHLLLLIVMYLRSESISLTSRGWASLLITFVVMLVGIVLAVYAWWRKW